MKVRRLFYAGGVLWELLRFFILFSVSTRVLYQPETPGGLLLLSWLGGYQLAMAAGFFFLTLEPERYRHFISLFAVAKFLSLISGISLFLLETIFALPVVSTHPSGRLLFLLLGAVVLLDLLFFTILLSSRTKEEEDDSKKTEKDESSSSLPEWKEIPLQEE